ncbi:MAG: ABC transporter ATP-binding protein [Gammaproteobacteria bacterium]|nr:ABC transporter ATP-binding protein [Gammaproteobacteria bacterium]
MSSPVIKLEGISHRYKQKNAPSLVIPAWQVESQQQVFLHGDSGSGKSTLLNLLSGVLTPTEGSIEVLGENLTKMSSAQRDQFRAQNIGVVFQTFNLIPYLSVLENIQLAVYFASKSQHQVIERAEHLLSNLHLDLNILKKPVSQLSIGQQQRVAIVRALINEPELLLVDEPTSALDASARDAFLNVLINTSKTNNTSMIFVSHDKAIEHYFSQSVEITALTEQQGV